MPRPHRKPLSAFGKSLQSSLSLHGLTIAEFSKAIGVHGSTVWRWMTGVSSPRAEHVVAMSTFLRTPVSALVVAEKRPPRRKSAAAR